MDGESIFFMPTLLNNTCELLSDIPEPSLSSLDESLMSNKDFCLADKDDCYSDGEAIRENSMMMTSTPRRKMEKRRSVSLVDVSKIDAYSTRPLGTILTSWETIGSQSSVGKSRDSGYIHSGSLLSVNSGKLSDMKLGSDQIHSILEECSRLKRELEYSEVVINTLQESNNELRMQCASAHNRISELRLKCANHSTFSSIQVSQVTLDPNISTTAYPFIMEVMDSPSSSSSRSLSPDLSPCTIYDLNYQPRNSNFITSPEETQPDQSEGQWQKGQQSNSTTNCTWSPWPAVEEDEPRTLGRPMSKANRSRSVKEQGHLRIQSTQGQRVLNESELVGNQGLLDMEEDQTVQSCSLGDDKCGITEDNGYLENRVTQSDLIDRQVQTERDENHVENLCVDSSEEESFLPSFEGQISLLNTSPTENNGMEEMAEEAVIKVEENPVFVANEVDGKVWVGSFKVWGDSSIRVAPKSVHSTDSPCAVKVRSTAEQSLEKLSALSSMSSSTSIPCNVLANENCSENTVSSDINFHLSEVSPFCNVKHVNVTSTRVRDPKVAESSQNNSWTTLNHQGCNISVQPLQNRKNCLSSRMDSVNISVSSKSDQYQLKISQNTHSRSNSTSFKSFNRSYDASNNSLEYGSVEGINSINSFKVQSPSNMINGLVSSRPATPCKENLAGLGVSVIKRDKHFSPETVMNKLKSLKSKFEKISLGSLISTESSDGLKKNQNSSANIRDQSSSNLNCSKIVSDSPIANPDSVLGSSPLTPLNNESNSSPLILSSTSSMHECLEKANEYARELSKGLSRLPSRLDYIQSIGRP